MKFINFLFLVSFASIFLFSCGDASQSSTDPSLKRYPLRGEIVSLDKASKKASIKHEKIEGYMDAMTMDFEIRKPDWVWSELVPGSVVTGDLVVDNVNGDYWLEINGVLAPQKSDQDSTPIREDKAVVGQKLVDFSLTDQNGNTVTPRDFEGKALAITFIYAQCPLPDFCILMSKNFSDVANVVAVDETLKDDVRLLSISFDPARDTPDKLKSYGLGYLGKDSKAKDFKVWQLAVGAEPEVKKVADFAGLMYEVDENDKTQFRHSLRTLIVGPDGTVKKVLSGNDWKPVDLINELKSAAEPPKKKE
ncbi:MAG: SCO family protein [Acidobacteriota bacterium]|nr:SCO family protein [Acidobacteriota bacterium]MDH3528230.1 SCO family protein [Acidobacteriota bacterium]